MFFISLIQHVIPQNIFTLIENIKQYQPDLLIVDVVLPAGIIAGEAMKIPTACLFHMPEYLPGANRPPGGLGLVPGQNALGKFRDKLLGKVFDKIFNKYLSKINAIRKSLNLPDQKNVADLFRNCDLRIIQTSEAFDFPILPKPKNVVYTGPVLDDPDWVEDWKNPFDRDDKRPLVVVALSTTFQNQKQVIQNCIDALGELNVKGLITLGLAMENEKFNLPENVKAIANASHAQIFPHADCVITHAGHGTVMRALANGVPMLCIPMGRDQGDNASKVAFHGTGIKISAKSNASTISNAVKKILSDANYKKHARIFGGKIIVDSKKGNIVVEIENSLKNSTSATVTLR
jgi:MGT family glycosyltransferase